MSSLNDPPSPRPVRNLTVLTRKPALTPDEFSRHWREVHAPLVRELPGIRRYSQNHVIESGTRASFPTADYAIDGIVDFVFDSREDMGTAFAGEIGRRVMEDAQNFIERMSVYTVAEHVVIDRTSSS